jgi:hypothetical protein
MASPLPGMDPYIETDKLWPLFQHHLVSCLHQRIPSLLGTADRYRVRVGQRVYSVEQALFTSVIREEHIEEFIEIRQRSDGKLVTLIEVVSPANKTTIVGREAFLKKRNECRVGGNSFVDIDLVLQGQPMIEHSREGLPAWEYAITVTRATQPERPDTLTASLQKRLPRFRLPLAPDDRDTVIDLQENFARCYDQGDFAAKIEYSRDPAVPLSEENRKWLHEFLKQQKLR